MPSKTTRTAPPEEKQGCTLTPTKAYNQVEELEAENRNLQLIIAAQEKELLSLYRRQRDW